jgi:hypothetical protein
LMPLGKIIGKSWDLRFRALPINRGGKVYH